MLRIGSRRSLISYRSSASGAYDPSALAYFNYLISIGDSPSTTFKNAYNAFVVGAKSASIYTKFLAIYPIAPTSFTGAKVNAVDLGSMTTVNMTSGDWSPSGGLQFDGSTKYATSGFSTSGNPSYFTSGGGHISTYSNTKNYILFGGECLIGDAGTFLLIANGASGDPATVDVSGMIGNTAFNAYLADAYSSSLAPGFMCASRKSSTNTAIYQGSTLLANSNRGATYAATDLNIGRQNTGGGINYSAENLLFCTIGSSLSDSEEATLAGLVTTYQSALGRS